MPCHPIPCQMLPLLGACKADYHNRTDYPIHRVLHCCCDRRSRGRLVRSPRQKICNPGRGHARFNSPVSHSYRQCWHPSDSARLHLAERTLRSYGCVRARGVAAASCAITSITIFMTLSRVSRPTDREESERGAAKAQSHKTRPSVARCSPSSASERERTQPKIGLHLRVRFEATL